MCPFTRKKCPENNGKKGCKMWLLPSEPPLINAKSGDKFPSRGMCLFHVGVGMLWDANVTLIGNQQAVEGFRNGMIEEVDGVKRPKSDLLTATLLKVLTTKPETHSQMIDNIETLMIEGEYEDSEDN